MLYCCNVFAFAVLLLVISYLIENLKRLDIVDVCVLWVVTFDQFLNGYIHVACNQNCINHINDPLNVSQDHMKCHSSDNQLLITTYE